MPLPRLWHAGRLFALLRPHDSVCLYGREPLLVELNRRTQRVLHTLAQYLSHRCAPEEYDVFGHVLGLVAQRPALAAESAAVKQNIHLLHELNPKKILVGVEGRHEPLDATCLNLVRLVDLHRIHGASLAQHFPQGGNLVPLVSVVLAAAFVLGAFTLTALFLFSTFTATSAAGFMTLFAISLSTPCYGGASVVLLALPEGLQVVGTILSTVQRCRQNFQISGSKTQADLLTLFFGEFQTTFIGLGMPLVEIEISILFDISFQRRITYQKYLLSR